MKVFGLDVLAAVGFLLTGISSTHAGFVFTTVPDRAGANHMHATGISGNTIIGSYGTNSGDFNFSKTGGVYTLLTGPSGPVAPLGISGNTIVGVDRNANIDHGFSETNGIYTTLDNPTAGGTGTTITGISGNTLIGYTGGPDPIFQPMHAFSETGGIYTPLIFSNPAIPTSSIRSTVPTGISGDTIIGEIEYQLQALTLQRWFTETGGVYSLLPFGINFTGVSGNAIVGYDAVGGGPFVGVLYIDGVVTHFSYPGGLPTLPRGIDGNTIVGNYFDANGKEHIFLATFDVPEPASLGLLGTGAVALWARRRRA